MTDAATDAAPPARPIRLVPLRGAALSAWCVVAAFGAYFCMYAFRKPFTAAAYSDATLFGLDYKVVLVTAQVLGYTLSKFIGIKVIAEMQPRHRAGCFLALIAAAEAALVLFGLTPAPYNFVCLFFNGLPLGMVFGLVLGFLEGRRQSEALTAGLCASFIVADGVTKSVGAYLLGAGVSEYQMPALAGLLFTPCLLLFVWMLTCIPAPSAADVASRAARAPMTAGDRWGFFFRYAGGLSLLMLVYLLVTVLRSVRADFAPELWKGLGVSKQPAVFGLSEMAVAAGVIALNGAVVFVRGHRAAFFTAMGLSLGGAALVCVSLLLLRQGLLSPFAFVVLHGLGLYLPYIAVHTTIFERLIAMTRDRGNVGYLMYLVDAFGYLGYVAVMLARNVLGPAEEFLGFFVSLSWVIGGACVVLLVPCWYYFATHPATNHRATP